MLNSGMSTEQILQDHPELEKEDIQACLDIPKGFLKNKAELDEILRQMDAGELESYTLEEFEKMVDDYLQDKTSTE